MMNEQLKLSELNGLVKKAIGEAFSAPVWVVAEISELKVNRNGHCYLVLIEKDEKGDAIVAQARAQSGRIPTGCCNLILSQPRGSSLPKD